MCIRDRILCRQALSFSDGEREGLPTEYQYELEQEMLKHIHKLKQELSEKGWSQKESPEVFQTSFLRSEESDAQLGFQFE